MAWFSEKKLDAAGVILFFQGMGTVGGNDQYLTFGHAICFFGQGIYGFALEHKHNFRGGMPVVFTVRIFFIGPYPDGRMIDITDVFLPRLQIAETIGKAFAA